MASKVLGRGKETRFAIYILLALERTRRDHYTKRREMRANAIRREERGSRHSARPRENGDCGRRWSARARRIPTPAGRAETAGFPRRSKRFTPSAVCGTIPPTRACQPKPSANRIERIPLLPLWSYRGRFVCLGARASRPQSRVCALALSHKGLIGGRFLVRIRIFRIIGFSGFAWRVFDRQALTRIRLGGISYYGENGKLGEVKS